MSKRTTTTARIAAGALACVLAATIALPSALAADATPKRTEDTAGDTVSITQVDTSRFPIVRAAFGADETPSGEPPRLTFSENGEKLTGVSVYRGEIGRYEDRSDATVMLVLDTSLSMRGQRLTDAIAAAKELLTQANPKDRIGLVTFGGDAELVVKPTTKHDRLTDALAKAEPRNRTTTYDGVELASRALLKAGGTRNAIVLLSDGDETSSRSTLDEAAGAAIKASAPVYSIAIGAKSSDLVKQLARLSNGTGGELKTVTGSGELGNLFAELGRRILQPYWIEYKSNAPVRAQVQLGITVGAGARPDAMRTFRAVATSTQSVQRGNEYVPPQKATPAEPVIPLPDGPLGVALVGLPFGILLFWLSWSFLRRRTAPSILSRIDLYTRPPEVQAAAASQSRSSALRVLAGPLLRISDAFLGRSKFFAKITRRAEQAAIAIKPAELFGAMVVLGLLGGLLGFVVRGPLAGGLALLVLGSVPNIWLILKARKRRKLFEDQLPDILQGIASSLNAGHSFNQAINAMIKDAPSPTNEEFQRVMTEARLGMPIEEALGHMAQRMGSDDFDFAVTTVNIQRTVGGSLSEILEMVGDTVRNRQQFRKKVKALSSMGTMSAYVLLGMPFFIALAISLMSPAYMAPLFTTTAGHFLIAAGLFSMFLGYVACMKVVKIEV